MSDLTIRIFPSDQKLIATTIYLGEEYNGQGCTVADTLIDLANEMKGIANEVRTRRQYIPPTPHSLPLPKDSKKRNSKALLRSVSKAAK